MLKGLKLQRLYAKTRKEVRKARKEILKHGDNPVEIFTKLFNDTNKEIMKDAIAHETPMEYLVASLQSSLIVANEMGVKPSQSEAFVRILKRIDQMAKARGLESPSNLNDPESWDK